MPENKQLENEKQKEQKKEKENKTSQKVNKKIATGNTKKVVQKRSSSVVVKTNQNKQEKTNKPDKEKEITQMQEVLEKEIKSQKQIPKEEQKKIYGKIFPIICLTIVSILYFNFIILGFINIENSVFVVDLKVFSMALLVVAIGLFEYAYKKDSGKYAILGIEVLVIAIITMAFIYLNLMYSDKFIVLATFITYVIAIYYIAKAIIVYQKMKKQYFIDHIKEMIKK